MTLQGIMILGAGIYQVPLIQKAKEMGLYTIVCSIPGNYPGFAFADRLYYVNTTDQEKILEIAKQEHIKAILTTGTDVAVKTIGYVCEQLDLPGITFKSASLATDKYLMKEAFQKNKVACAQSVQVTNLQEACQVCTMLGYPAMIKCTDSSGSRGISRVDAEIEVPKAVEEAFKYTNKNYILVEEFIFGHEIGLDGFVGMNGQDLFMVPHDKLTYNNGLTNIPIGHIFPYECGEPLKSSIFTETLKAVKALGLENCFFNLDLLVSNEQAFVIEAGARTGATCIPELLSVHCGFDFYEKMIAVSLGKRPNWDCNRKTFCAAKLIIAHQAGILSNYKLPHIDPNHECISLDYQIGDSIPVFRNGSDRIGHMMAWGDSKKETLLRLKMLESKIKINLKR